MEENPLILPVVLGPTASGKSELALHIASRIGGEIVNCDSLQIYRGFDVGTAKLTQNERRGIPHHLVDVVNPDQLFSAGDYARVGRCALHEIAGRGVARASSRGRASDGRAKRRAPREQRRRATAPASWPRSLA